MAATEPLSAHHSDTALQRRPDDSDDSDPAEAGGYDPERKLPRVGYAALLGTYVAGVGSLLAVAGPRLPKRIPWGDLALLAVATHKLSRLVTRDRITAPLRAPFTRFERTSGAGEVRETSRGGTLRRAVGDLLTCTFCFGPWASAGLIAGYLARPDATRVVAAILATATGADVLQHFYAAARKLPG